MSTVDSNAISSAATSSASVAGKKVVYRLTNRGFKGSEPFLIPSPLHQLHPLQMHFRELKILNLIILQETRFTKLSHKQYQEC